MLMPNEEILDWQYASGKFIIVHTAVQNHYTLYLSEKTFYYTGTQTFNINIP